MLLLLYFLLLLPYVFGGTQCVPRSAIYPCICINKQIGKSKFHTTVICQGLDDGNSVLAIESGLAEMEIDHFLLYDAYWSNELRSVQAASRVPINLLSRFKMAEVEVIDSKMSSFACPREDNCRTSFLKKFTAINTTMPEKSPCSANGNTVLSIKAWVSCPEHLEELTIDNGIPAANTKLRPDFFPDPMTNLKVLRLPNNRISEIDKRTFSKFQSLEVLDLSHNSLREVRNIFSSMLKLKVLDLSFNSIRSSVNFQFLPHLSTLNLKKNEIQNLLENDWTNIPEKFRHLDLSNNPLNCGCGIRFINSTFHINANLNGTCNSPEKTRGKSLRKACKFLIERCDAQGNIGSKRKFP